MRVCATHAWPLFMSDANLRPWIVAARSASSRMIAADLPPSSRLTRLSCSPQMAAMRRPAAVEPVNAILSTPGWRTRCSPTSRPAGITLTTPLGMPASSRMSAMRKASSGVSGDGLMTIVHPAINAGASFDIVTNCGTFHGTIAPTTPTGSRRTTTSLPRTPWRRSSHGYSRAMSRNVLSIIHGAGDCARFENEIGEPISSVITAAMSGMCAAYASLNFWTAAIRSSGARRGHSPLSKASRAAATARSMSAAVPSGTRPTSSSVCGEITSMVPVPAGSTHSPPMNSRWCSRMDVLLDPCTTQTRTGSTTAATRLSLSLHVAQQQPGGRLELLAHGADVRPPVHPAEQRREPHMRERPNDPWPELRVHVPHGLGEHRGHDRGHLALAAGDGGIGRRDGRDHGRGEQRLMLLRAGRAPEHVDDAVGGGVALGRTSLELPLLLARELDLARGQQMVLRREVPVDRSQRDARLAGDVTHLHRVVATVRRQLHGGVDDALTARRLVRRECTEIELDCHQARVGTPASKAAISVSRSSSCAAVRR